MIQIEFTEHELRVVVAGVSFQLRPCPQDSACRIALKRRNEVAAAVAQLERFVLVCRVADEPLDLKEQSGRSQFVRVQIVGLDLDEVERQSGGRVVGPVVEERLCIFKRCPVRGGWNILRSLRGTRRRTNRL
jgi:hypothetical protein